MPKLRELHLLALEHYLLPARLFIVLSILAIPLLTAVPASSDWTPDTRLSTGTGEAASARVAVSGNNVHVVWEDNRDGGRNQIYYKRSTDSGLTWGADSRLTSIPSGVSSLSIAVSGNNVHIAWQSHNTNYLDEYYDIYYLHSSDNGLSWGSVINISNQEDDDSRHPSIAVLGNNVYIVWYYSYDYQIYYCISTDGGQTWGTPTQLSNTPERASYPSVAAGGNVFAVWQDSRDDDPRPNIYYNRSTDWGMTWGTDTSLSTIAGYRAEDASVAISGSNVFVVWTDTREGDNRIYYRLSSNGGVTWGTETALSSGYGRLSFVAVSGSNVYVVWEDTSGATTQVFYNYSTDGGQTWAGDAQLSGSTGDAEFPDIAVSVGNVVHVVWDDNRDGSNHIYYKRSPGNTPVAQPTVTVVNPASSNQGQCPITVVITGTNLTMATAVSFGTGITVSNIVVNSATQITVTICVDVAATPGANNVSVTTPGGTGIKTAAFTVVQQNQSIGTGAPTSHGSSISGATTTTQPVVLPNIQTQSASLSAKTVTPGTPITVTVNIANKSAVNGNKKVTLYVNGQVETTQGVTVNSGGSTQLTFSVSRSEPGEYSIYVDGVPAGSFKVELFRQSDAILIFSAALVALAFLIGMVLLWRRQRAV